MNQLIILAIDGLSWNVIHNLIAQGKLKNLNKIIKKATSGILNPDKPLLSPQIWASIFTGKMQDKHGIKDFYSTKEDLKFDQIWDILDNFNITVGIYRALTALSLKKTGSFFIPSFYSFENKSYPEKLTFIKNLDQKARLDELSLYTIIITFWNLLKFCFPITGLIKLIVKSIILKINKSNLKKRLFVLKTIELLIHSNLFYTLIKRYKPQFSIIYDNSCDTLSHVFWRDYVQKNKFSNVIPKIYEKIDDYVGKIYNYVRNKNSNLLIISDHGFRLIKTENPQLISKLYNKTIKTLNLLRYLHLENDVYVTNLGTTTLFRLKPNSSITIGELKEKIDAITCKGEKIFIINELENILIAKLKFFIENEEESIVRLSENLNVKTKSIINFATKITGHHDENNGVFIITGANIKEGENLGIIKPYDITPTLLNMLGVSVPEGLDGRILGKIFKIKPKVSYYKQMKKEEIEEKTLSEEEEEIIKERLRSLGYID